MAKVCKRCGKCCKRFYFEYSRRKLLVELNKAVEEGHVGDIIEFAKYLVMMEWSKKKIKTGQWIVSCKFYDKKKGCTIYKHRPFMCKNYPYGRKGAHKGCEYKGRKKEVAK